MVASRHRETPLWWFGSASRRPTSVGVQGVVLGVACVAARPVGAPAPPSLSVWFIPSHWLYLSSWQGIECQAREKKEETTVRIAQGGVQRVVG